jgi:hypothetical protein
MLAKLSFFINFYSFILVYLYDKGRKVSRASRPVKIVNIISKTRQMFPIYVSAYTDSEIHFRHMAYIRYSTTQYTGTVYTHMQS